MKSILIVFLCQALVVYSQFHYGGSKASAQPGNVDRNTDNLLASIQKEIELALHGLVPNPAQAAGVGGSAKNAASPAPVAAQNSSGR